ncbi:hypothetical protein IWQ60_008518 [Tieghemiomyces parasiticus]|uniref:Uncharacterized protein n=1 Tax=Tieghemiomyces parasiticus TaxID=78921 RepID=A0A9W8DRV4_9FUNG|nr:hypothetical protein IWQ60_008518 [Tieghemiomyces parasiticus]
MSAPVPPAAAAAVRALPFTSYHELTLALANARTDRFIETVVDLYTMFVCRDHPRSGLNEIRNQVLFDYLRAEPTGAPLLNLLDLTADQPLTDTVAELLQVLNAVLLAVSDTDVASAGHTMAMRLVTNGLPLLYTFITGPLYLVRNAALTLLCTIARYSPEHTRQLAATFDMRFEGWDKILYPFAGATPPRTTVEVDSFRPDNQTRRSQLIRLVTALLANGDESTKVHLLSQHALMGGILRELDSDSYELVFHVLSVFHDHILSDSRLPRRSRLAAFTERSMRGLFNLLHRGQAVLVTTGAVSSLVETRRTVPIQQVPGEPQPTHPLCPRPDEKLHANQASQEKDYVDSVAALAQRFLVRLCATPGFGLCVKDNGWYTTARQRTGESVSDPLGSDDEDDEEPDFALEVDGPDGDDLLPAGGQAARPRNLYLLRILRACLDPTRHLRREQFLLTVLRASPGLVAPYLASDPLDLTPALSVAYLANAALLVKVLALPNPHDPTEPGTCAPPALTTPPPPVASLTGNVVPSVLTRALFNRCMEAPSPLVRYTVLLTLAAVCRKLDRVLGYLDAQLARLRTAGLADVAVAIPWEAARRALVAHVRLRVPDFRYLTTLHTSILKTPRDKSGKASGATKGSVPRHDLIWEVTLKVIQVYQAHFPELTLETPFYYGSLVPSLPEVIHLAGLTYDESDAHARAAVARSLMSGLAILRHTPGFRWSHRTDTVTLDLRPAAGLCDVSLSFAGVYLLLALTVPHPALARRARNLVRDWLVAAGLFSHRPAEFIVWFVALRDLIPTLSTNLDTVPPSYCSLALRQMLGALHFLDREIGIAVSNLSTAMRDLSEAIQSAERLMESAADPGVDGPLRTVLTHLPADRPNPEDEVHGDLAFSPLLASMLGHLGQRFMDYRATWQAPPVLHDDTRGNQHVSSDPAFYFQLITTVVERLGVTYPVRHVLLHLLDRSLRAAAASVDLEALVQNGEDWRPVIAAPAGLWTYGESLLQTWLALGAALPPALARNLVAPATQKPWVPASLNSADILGTQRMALAAVTPDHVGDFEVAYYLDRLAPTIALPTIRALSSRQSAPLEYLDIIIDNYLRRHIPFTVSPTGEPALAVLVQRSTSNPEEKLAAIFLNQPFAVLHAALTLGHLTQPVYQHALAKALQSDLTVQLADATDASMLGSFAVQTARRILDSLQRTFLTDRLDAQAKSAVNTHGLGLLTQLAAGLALKSVPTAVVRALAATLAAHPLVPALLDALAQDTFPLHHINETVAGLHSLLAALPDAAAVVATLPVWCPVLDRAVLTLRVFLAGASADPPAAAVARSTAAFLALRDLYPPAALADLVGDLVVAFEAWHAIDSTSASSRAMAGLLSQLLHLTGGHPDLFTTDSAFRRTFAAFLTFNAVPNLYVDLDAVASLLVPSALPALPLPAEVSPFIPGSTIALPRADQLVGRLGREGATADTRPYLARVLPALTQSSAATVCRLIQGHRRSLDAFRTWVTEHWDSVVPLWDSAATEQMTTIDMTSAPDEFYPWLIVILSYLRTVLSAPTAADPNGPLIWQSFALPADRALVATLTETVLPALLVFGTAVAAEQNPATPDADCLRLIGAVARTLLVVPSTVLDQNSELVTKWSDALTRSLGHRTSTTHAHLHKARFAPLGPTLLHWLAQACACLAAGSVPADLFISLNQLTLDYLRGLFAAHPRTKSQAGPLVTVPYHSEAAALLNALVSLYSHVPSETEGIEASLHALLATLVRSPDAFAVPELLEVVVTLLPRAQPTEHLATLLLADLNIHMKAHIRHLVARSGMGYVDPAERSCINSPADLVATEADAPPLAAVALTVLLHTAYISSAKWSISPLRRLLPFYTAGPSLRDQLIRHFLGRFERETRHSVAKYALLWGPAGRAEHWGALFADSKKAAETNRTADEATVTLQYLQLALRCLDARTVARTCLTGAFDMALDGDTLMAPFDILCNRPGPWQPQPVAYDDATGGWARAAIELDQRQRQFTTLAGVPLDHLALSPADRLYDPAFLLALLTTFVHLPRLVPLDRLVQTNLFAVAVVALSSASRRTRRLAYTALGHLNQWPTGPDFGARAETLFILQGLRASLRPAGHPAALEAAVLADPDPCLPRGFTAFLAAALDTVNRPHAPVYPALATYLLEATPLRMGEVPMLTTVFRSTSDHARRERRWLLEVLGPTLRTPLDFAAFDRAAGWDLVTSYYSSPMANLVTRQAILRVIYTATQAPAGLLTARLFTTGLLPWLHQQVLTNTWRVDTDLIVGLLRVVRSLLVHVRPQDLGTNLLAFDRAVLALVRAAASQLLQCQRARPVTAATRDWYLTLLFEVQAITTLLHHRRAACTTGLLDPQVPVDVIRSLFAVLRPCEALVLPFDRSTPANLLHTSATCNAQACPSVSLALAQTLPADDLFGIAIATANQVLSNALHLFIETVGGLRHQADPDMATYAYGRALYYGFGEYQRWMLECVHAD